jgi:hypothetical protein
MVPLFKQCSSLETFATCMFLRVDDRILYVCEYHDLQMLPTDLEMCHLDLEPAP